MTFLFLKGVRRWQKKRLKKKQQSKQNIESLKRVGIQDKKRLKELKNKPSIVKKIVKKETRNITARERSDYMRNILGLKMDKKTSPIRYWGEERYQSFIKDQLKIKEKEKQRRQQKERRKERERKNDQDLYLLIFWK
jgi:hypothetical protein